MTNTSKPATERRWYQERGVRRREKLILALRDLLADHEISDVRYQAIADLAGIPLPSCYNLFKSKADLIQALAEYYSPLFNEYVFAPLDSSQNPESWTDLVDVMINRAATFLRDNAAVRRIWFGFDVPPEVVSSTRGRERSTAGCYKGFIGSYFKLPDIANLDEIFYLALEIADRIMHVGEYSAVLPHDFYVEEAMRAQKAYLSIYIPPRLLRASE